LNAKKTKLKNGILVTSLKMENTDTVSAILMLKGGVIYEPRNLNGITHLIEHLCFRRLAGIPQRELYYKIERSGGHLRAATYRDYVVFELTMPKEYFVDIPCILRSLFDDNRWTYEDIRLEKEIIYREVEQTGDWTYKRIVYDFFEENSYGAEILGTKNKIKKLTYKQIIDWKNNLFENPEIVLCGNFSDVQLDEFCKAFTDIPSLKNKEPVDIMPKSFLMRNSKSDRCYTEQGDYLKLGISFDLNIDKPTAKLMVKTLFGLGISPFNMRLREKMGFVYDIDTSFSYFDFGGILTIILDVHKDKAVSLIKEFAKTLIEQKCQIDYKAFECAQKRLDFENQIAMQNSQDIAYRVAFDENNGFSKITYEQLQDGARKVFSPQNMIVNLNDVAPEQELLDALYEEKEKFREKLGE